MYYQMSLHTDTHTQWKNKYKISLNFVLTMVWNEVQMPNLHQYESFEPKKQSVYQYCNYPSPLLTHLLVETVVRASLGIARSRTVTSAVRFTFTMLSLASGVSFLVVLSFFTFTPSSSAPLVLLAVSVPLTVPSELVVSVRKKE